MNFQERLHLQYTFSRLYDVSMACAMGRRESSSERWWSDSAKVLWAGARTSERDCISNVSSRSSIVCRWCVKCCVEIVAPSSGGPMTGKCCERSSEWRQANGTMVPQWHQRSWREDFRAYTPPLDTTSPRREVQCCSLLPFPGPPTD